MPSAISQSQQSQQQELFSDSVIDRKKTRDNMMKQLNDYQPIEGDKKPKIKAQHNDLLWVLVSLLNEAMIALRNNSSRSYKHSIKHCQFSFAAYKTELIQQVSNRNNVEPMGMTTLNTYLKFMQKAGLLLAANRKIRSEKGIETSQTTFFFTAKLIVLATTDEPKKAIFCTPNQPKKRINNYLSNFNKNIKNSSEAANSLDEEKKRLEKKGAVRDKTDAGTPVETANLSEKEKSCGKKEKAILNDGTLAGQTWAQMYEALYPTWNINADTQRESTQIIANLLDNVADALESQFYQRVKNGVEKEKEKQRELYRQADEAGKAKIMKNLQQRLDGTRDWFEYRKPCAKTQAFAILSRAITKVPKYNEKKGFTLNIYPTKYLANQFMQALDWAHQEYNQISRHRQSEDMKQLAAARALYYKLFSQIAVVRHSKGRPEISQREAMQAKYATVRREFVAHIQNNCQQLTDDTKQNLLQEFDAQVATALLACSPAPQPQPNTTTQEPKTQHTGNQHTDTATYDVRSEGETFQNTDWQKQTEYEKVLRKIDDDMDTLSKFAGAYLAIKKNELNTAMMHRIMNNRLLEKSQKDELIAEWQLQISKI